MIEKIDFSPGKITYNDFYIDKNLTLEENSEFWIMEDLLQVTYPNNFLLDVGWHAKAFVVCIVKDHNWENYVFKKKCKTLDELKKKLEECVNKMRFLIKNEERITNDMVVNINKNIKTKN